MFRGHYQPHIPADLGFYDLRVPETRIAQAEMAKEYGIEAFCYYHYWFSGRRLLERPFAEVLESGEPDFPFCLCWANRSWTGIWYGASDRVLIEQTYPGEEDHCAHFYELLRAFGDSRYVTVDGKPLFLVYRPKQLPDAKRVTDLWRDMAEKSGLKGLYLVGISPNASWIPQQYGFDASGMNPFPERRGLVSKRNPIKWLIHEFQEKRALPTIYRYKKVCLDLVGEKIAGVDSFPSLIPNWDNTPRSGPNGIVLHGSTPELFRSQVKKAISMINDKPVEQKLIFVKSWNEWGEGNHLEPDLKFGKAYLEVIRSEIFERKID